MKEKILETFRKLPDKHEYLKVSAGVDTKNPDLWVKENILESPLPVQEMFYKQLTEDYDKIEQKIQEKKRQLEWELGCKAAKEDCLKKLHETDWTQLPDVPLDQKEKRAYREYRKWLRRKYKNVENKIDNNFKVMDYETWKESYDLYN